MPARGGLVIGSQATGGTTLPKNGITNGRTLPCDKWPDGWGSMVQFSELNLVQLAEGSGTASHAGKLVGLMLIAITPTTF
jgi:hypothetical protein